MGLDFCPFETDEKTGKFARIDMSNLAYELIYQNGYTELDLKGTILESSHYLKAKTDERLKAYKDASAKMILEEGIPGKQENQLQELLRRLDEEKQNETSAAGRGNGSPDAMEDTEVPEGGETGLLLDYQLHEDGSYGFSFSPSAKKAAGEIMRALPCCPRCHKRLPLGWNNKDIEDFYSISLLSSTGEGKTSFLLAMMEKKWRRLGAISSNLYVYPAHIIDDDHDQYRSLENQSEKMCQDHGECPPPTPNGYVKINPVFLRVQYEDQNRILHNMLLGIYDNSGEVLRAMNPGDNRIQMLLNMNAIIYFIDPKNMKVELPAETARQRKARVEANLLDTIQKQGEFQRENRRIRDRGEELLREDREMVQSTRQEKESPFALYRDFRNATMTADPEMLDRNKRFMKKQHLCCTIIKSDLLQESPQMREIPHMMELFTRDPEYNYLDEDIQYAREQIVQEVCSQFVFSRREMEIMEKDMKSVSWHCISSLGCGTEEIRPLVFRLKGRFDPIRVEEPLVICMRNRFRENGWEEQE
ncbi:MAG TPA: hypothetical protein H9775_15135 [Candidatus Blautia merdipullorum]|nr:hypothetical protein [Candidatus Blautia merdipullorum]